MMKKLVIEKRSSLFSLDVSDEEKSFYNIKICLTLASIRLWWKGLQWKNALAYFPECQWWRKKFLKDWQKGFVWLWQALDYDEKAFDKQTL